MSDKFIGIDVTGLKELAAKLEKLPGAVADNGVESANIYLRNVMRLSAPYKYISRKQAYSKSFFSDRQRRWFFAALRDGRVQIPYNRTQALARGWKTIGKGKNQILVNEAEGAQYVQGNWPGEQSRHEHAVGWQGVNEVIVTRINKIVEAFDVGVKKAIKRLGL